MAGSCELEACGDILRGKFLDQASNCQVLKEDYIP
jgi:hypothetical protein